MGGLFLPGTGNDLAARNQLALANLRVLLNSAVASGALVDGRQWELLSDEFAVGAVGQVYQGGSPAYYTAGASLIPAMTSNSAPSGVASASSEFSAAYAAWCAMDGSAATYWESLAAAAGVAWLKYEFPAARVVVEYAITAMTGTAGELQTMLRDWTFEGYAGATWDVLDTRAGVTWASGQRRAYAIANTTAYQRYRLNVTAASRSPQDYVSVQRLEMLSAAPPATAYLITPAVTLAASPPAAAVYLLWKDDSGGAAVLGTDLIIEVSRDGGASWTTIAPEVIGGAAGYDGTYAVVMARGFLTAQPAGTSLVCRVSCLSATAQRIGPLALYAE